MVDYRINLAKSLTSTVEERDRFYNRMLIYLVLGAAALIFVAYVSTINLLDYIENKQAHSQLLASASAEKGVDKAAFKNTDRAYARLQTYSSQISTLRVLLGQRKNSLPVVSNLFMDLPNEVILQSLIVDKDKLMFGLTMPPASIKSGDPVRKLKATWERNEELMTRVSTIRPLTGERRTVGGKSVFYVKFECILKK